MKINKACDLNSISVFPPPLVYPRKANNISSGLQASHSQHRSQPSQQSLSQGLSSQHGVLSHFSQNSLDEAVTTNDQRVGSQEHENSLRRISSLSRPTYSREESQAPNSRSSSNLMLKWNSADHKSQLSEGLEHRIGIMETSLSRFTMILDSVQSDVMQVNKGTKEIILEVECIRQKLIAQDNSLQLMTKGQEEIKAIIERSLKSLAEQMSHVSKKEKLQDVYLAVSALPQLIEASLQNVQNDLRNITKEMQARSTSKQITTPKMRQPLANEAKVSIQATVAPEVESGGWKPVKKERVTFSDRTSEKVQKKKEPHTQKYIRGGRDCAIVIESDEEIDGGFSCLVQENAGVNLLGNLTKEALEETERILRKARRRKRKSIF
ncbi:Protein PAIR1 [Glycine soja]|uniref:Protein PAIR1 n=1 Tax=Glycine soja TaxID=3848 RepID=A0A0B2R526_GLYSO|nr:Protein PAIR1 [Glycine soja]